MDSTPVVEGYVAAPNREQFATSSAFSREIAPLSNEEKRAIARLVKCKPDEAEVRTPDYVAKLKEAQARASGAAPRPEARLMN